MPLIEDNQQFNGATYSGGNYAIPTYDDGFGRLWISRNSIGINGIVRARTWHDAYEICEDEFFPEADETVEELQREYGFRREYRKVVRDTGVLVAGDHTAVGERFVRPSDYNPTLPVGMFVRWATISTPDPEAWPDNELFQEAYGFRPSGRNAKDTIGHGIYVKDLNGDYLDELTPELVSELGITLNITSGDICR